MSAMALLQLNGSNQAQIIPASALRTQDTQEIVNTHHWYRGIPYHRPVPSQSAEQAAPSPAARNEVATQAAKPNDSSPASHSSPLTSSSVTIGALSWHEASAKLDPTLLAEVRTHALEMSMPQL